MAEAEQDLEKSSIKKKKILIIPGTNPRINPGEKGVMKKKENNLNSVSITGNVSQNTTIDIPNQEIKKEENNFFNFFGIFSRFCKENRDDIKTIQEKTSESVLVTPRNNNAAITTSPNKSFRNNKAKAKYSQQSSSPEVNKGLKINNSNSPNIPVMTLGEMPTASANPGLIKKAQKQSPETNKNKSFSLAGPESPQKSPSRMESEGSNSYKSNDEDRDKVNEMEGNYKLLRNDKKKTSGKTSNVSTTRRSSANNNSMNESDIKSEGSSKRLNTNSSRNKDNQCKYRDIIKTKIF
jgi:hypothetical protein